MKNKIIMILTLISLVLLISNASAEITLWQTTILDNQNSIVRYHAYYQVEDTSDNLISIQKPVNVLIRYSTQNLPYNISTFYPQYANALVDWCNLTFQWQRNIFDNTENQNIINTTLETTSFYFTSGTNTGYQEFRLKNRDGLVVDADCHYTNVNTLFIDGVYFLSLDTTIPAFQCNECSAFTFEELSRENEKLSERDTQEVGIYSKIQNLVDKNYLVWNIVSWLLKIGLIFVALVLIFGVIYYIYVYIEHLARRTR